MNAPKNRIVWLGLCLALGILSARAQSQPLGGATVPPRCGIVAYEAILQQRDPSRLQKQQQLNKLIEQLVSQRKRSDANARVGETVFRIPVVVHVVHNNATQAIGGANNPNISEEQINSQMRVLNEDYRRKEGTRGYNTNPVGADTGIEFFLAKIDPNGQPTTGITRHYYPRQTSFNVYQDDLLLSQIAYWPSDRYLNIWVAPLDNGGGDVVIGYSQFPVAPAVTGLDIERNELTDGVFIDYRTFGSETGTVTRSTYLYGRTATHEIGHWLGLIHTWGDTFCGDDYCADTPPTESANQTTDCPETYSTCNGVRTRNQIENYLDYSPDACMNLFTKDQAARMRAVLEASPRRVRLVRSVEALPQPEQLTVTVYPNPTSSPDVTLDVYFTGFKTYTVSISDLLGRQIKSQQYTDYPSSSLALPLQTLRKGVYLITVNTGEETVTRRLFIH